MIHNLICFCLQQSNHDESRSIVIQSHINENNSSQLIMKCLATSCLGRWKLNKNRLCFSGIDHNKCASNYIASKEKGELEN